jgi:hypothetical protein
MSLNSIREHSIYNKLSLNFQDGFVPFTRIHKFSNDNFICVNVKKRLEECLVEGKINHMFIIIRYMNIDNAFNYVENRRWIMLINNTEEIQGTLMLNSIFLNCNNSVQFVKNVISLLGIGVI